MSADLVAPVASSRKHPIGLILKGSMVLMGGMLIAQTCGYGYRLVVARLGPNYYGLLSLGLAVVGVATMLASLGLPGGVARYVPFYHGREEYGKLRGVILLALGVVMATSLVVAGCLLFLASPLANLLAREGEFRQVLLIMALAIPFVATKPILMKSLVTLHRIELRVITRDVVENVVKLGLTALLVLMGYGLLGAVWAYAIAAALAWALGLYLLERRALPILSSTVKPVFQLGELLTFSFPLFFTGILGLFQAWTDTFLLSYFRTMTEVGLYNVGLLLASLVSVIPNLVLPAAFPHIINYYGRGEQRDARLLARQVSRWILLALAPVALWLILVSPQLLPLLFGNTYAEGARVAAVLTIGYLALSLSLPCTRVLSMVKRTDLIFRASLISVLVNVVGNLLLIPRYGMIGAALATAGSLVLSSVLLQWETWRNYAFIFVDKKTLPMVGAVIMAGVALVGVETVMGDSLAALVIGSVAFGAVYLSALPLLGALEESDWEVLSQVKERVRERWTK